MKNSRRHFLKKAAQLSAIGATSPLALNLAAISEAAAQEASDYKALVCVFLFGGNDHYQTLVPYDNPSYDKLAAIRPGVIHPRNELADTLLLPASSVPNGRQFAFSPNLKHIADQFNVGRLAVLMNIGTLVEPVTKATLQTARLPPKLMSHNDQQAIWQSGNPEGGKIGYGGKMGDRLASLNNDASTFTCINVSGRVVFITGENTIPYQMTGSSIGVNKIYSLNSLYGSAKCGELLRELTLAETSSGQELPAANHLYEREIIQIARRSNSNAVKVEDAFSRLPQSILGNSYPQNNTLANQLKVVAKMIASRNTMQTKRQVFFVGLSGFDNHSGLATAHSSLMRTLNDAISAFDNEMKAIGDSDKVTLFTASDFGRTLDLNGDGTDHAWGSIHFALGDAVRGQHIYGVSPDVSLDGVESYDNRGRWIPTTSVEQMMATLAKWFGVNDSSIETIFPNLRNFSSSDLGFMKP